MTMKSQITEKLQHALTPEHLEVVNESHLHNVPANSESHFKVFIVSNDFKNLPLIARHRLVNKVLEEALHEGIHALALHTMTMEEWFARGGAPDSPQCMGAKK